MLYIAGAGLTSIDPVTGNTVKSYKQCEMQKGVLAVSPFGLLAGQANKPLIHQYAMKETPLKKLILSEKISSIAVSLDWLAVGSQSGRLHIYSLSSGSLVASQDAHFQALTHLAFADGSAALVSAGADARVLIWRVADLVAAQTDGAVEPAHILTAHSLPITGLSLSKTDILRDIRLFTSSLDATVCVFSLFTGQLLHTLVVDRPLTAMAVDPAERAIYVGSDDGARILPLYRQSPSTRRLEAVGGAGAIVSFEGATLFECPQVTALALSQDATNLYVGDNEGGVSAWDVGTEQLVKKYKAVKGPVNALVVASTSTQYAELPALQRVVETEVGDCVLPAEPFVPDVTFDVDSAMGIFSGVAAPVASEAPSEELEQLRAKAKQYDQLKNMYDELWARHIKK